MEDEAKAGKHYETGNKFLDSGKFEEACAEYEKAIQLKQNFSDAYNNCVYAYNSWGNVLYTQKLYEEAIEKYRKAIDLDPDYVDAYYNWGLALANLKRYGAEPSASPELAATVPPNLTRPEPETVRAAPVPAPRLVIGPLKVGRLS